MVRLCSRIFFLLFVSLFISTSAYSQCKDAHKDDQNEEHSQTDELNGTEVEEGVLFGAALNQDLEVITFEQLISGSDEFNKKEIVVTGNISDVCQSSGCWVMLSDGNNSVRVKTNHDFFMPKDCSGKNAKVQGTFEIKEISEEEAEHYKDDSKDEGVSQENTKGLQKVYEVIATGVILMNDVN
jgi:hypothetical protein